ncbi:MAG: FHA domain-containing protein [Myxococcales bacterium]|jgi:class 3 adenylate cyclase|nr:FHA domain-containing protein [Myxococcales bacterium]
MWQLIINGPGYFDTAYELPDGETLLGRADENDVILSGDQVSRRHARLYFDKNELFFEDLGSRNGTRANGSFLSEPHRITEGDVFTIGENTLVVRQPSDFEIAKTELLADDDPLRAELPNFSQPMGEVLVSRSLDDNPFIENIGLLDNFSVQDFEMLPLLDNFGSSTGKLPVRPPKSDKEPSTDKKISLPERGELLLFAQVSEKLNSAKSLDEFLGEVMRLIVEIAHATTGIAFMFDEKGKLSPIAVRHTGDVTPDDMPVSRSIINEVARKKVALAVINAQSDANFSASKSVIMHGLEQVICAPMLKGNELLGLIYLNRPSKPIKSMPLSRLVDLVNALAHMLASGIEKWSSREQNLANLQLQHRLECFHSPAIVERIQSEGGFELDVLDKKQVTVMFLDLSGFTRACESLPASRISTLISSYYDIVRRTVFKFDGTLGQFMGDSALAVFGMPFSSDGDADRAIQCAQACRSACNALLAEALPNSMDCGVRIGLNTGMLLVGPMGPAENFEYVFFGHAMKIAHRLQEMDRTDAILITEDTLKATSGHFSIQPTHTFEQKLKPHKVHVYEVLEGDGQEKRSASVVPKSSHRPSSDLSEDDRTPPPDDKDLSPWLSPQAPRAPAAPKGRPPTAQTSTGAFGKKPAVPLRSIPPLPRLPVRPSATQQQSGGADANVKTTEEPRPATMRPSLPPLPYSKKLMGSSASTVVTSLPDLMLAANLSPSGAPAKLPPAPPRPRPAPGAKAPRDSEALPPASGLKKPLK